jgi:1,4-dihydroxy-2-naphthoate octaprenyltransferase
MGQVGAYFRLGKFQIYEHWLPVVVGWSVIADAGRVRGASLVAIVIVGVTAACFAGAGSALDDVQGVRDGIDQRTYQPQELSRKISTKPLLLGELSEHNARLFGFATAGVGFLGIVTVALTAPYRPLWLLAIFVVLAFAATQYSFGLKLSYHGLGELLLAVANAATLVAAIGFAAGRLPGSVFAEALLLLFWMAQITVFSSVADVAHDRAGGRTTAISLFADSSHAKLVGVMFLLGWSISLGILLAGLLPPILVGLLLPAWLLQALQLHRGFAHGNWLEARRLGWRAYDAGVVALVAANLLVAH